ncbi:hypothetical protein GQ43DRAFT_445379 [Delitschia confertaspora ATCC 74209]|uniref:Uncharacterized protein n=1 Tax=Delitschia confertaspora ATCC 74209 TaxID=1513339 RepID=A0A9P4JE37_9PLEO|nr:hypothetical protein GQ43DRAFT_445379 [Delitschia confertaspora ATCC 74209]
MLPHMLPTRRLIQYHNPLDPQPAHTAPQPCSPPPSAQASPQPQIPTNADYRLASRRPGTRFRAPSKSACRRPSQCEVW